MMSQGTAASAIGTLKTKMNAMKNEIEDLKVTNEKLLNTIRDRDADNFKLETETAALTRRITLLEDDLERSEERLGGAQQKLDQASKAADESERQRRSVQNKLIIGDDRIDEIEKLLREANETASDAQARYDEAARRVIVLERELAKTEEKSEENERKARILEAELREISNNVKTIELVEETASQREDSYEETIRDLTQRLKDAEARAEFSEREIISLQKSLERMEDELNQAQEHNSKLRTEMEQCLGDLADI